jgi:hypothetical protein
VIRVFMAFLFSTEAMGIIQPLTKISSRSRKIVFDANCELIV